MFRPLLPAVPKTSSPRRAEHFSPIPQRYNEDVNTNDAARELLYSDAELSEFVLADVGVSGGFDQRWDVNGRTITKYGFDPLVSEIERLRSLSYNSEHYEAAWVVGPQATPRDEVQSTLFHRTSAHYAMTVMASKSRSYTQEIFNAGKPVVLSDREIQLDSYFLDRARIFPNFLKVDTDGFDLGVLRGSSRLLQSPDLFGIQIECQFHGNPKDADSNNFSNIDLLLRENGFVLYQLEPHSYSRSALPSRFLYKIAAQTESGTVQMGDAVYFRDPWVSEDFQNALLRNEPLVRKYLFGLITFGFPDVAVDAMTSLNINAEKTLPVDRILDCLNTSTGMGSRTYSELIALFQSDFTKFFPARSDGILEELVSIGLLSRWPRLRRIWRKCLELPARILSSRRGRASVAERCD